MSERRRARVLAPLLAATALVAALAIAGPTSAKNGSDRHKDDSPAGTIASYDSASGVLTIDLAKGGSASGLVTRHTWIDDGKRGCSEDRRARAADRKARSGKRGSKGRHGSWCHDRRHGKGNGKGHNHGRWRGGGDVSDLVPGAVVEDAILVLKDGQAWFAKVDLD